MIESNFDTCDPSKPGQVCEADQTSSQTQPQLSEQNALQPINNEVLPVGFSIEKPDDKHSVVYKCSIHSYAYLLFGIYWCLILIAFIAVYVFTIFTESRSNISLAFLYGTPVVFILFLIVGIIYIKKGIRNAFFSTWFKVSPKVVEISHGFKRETATSFTIPRDGSITAEVNSKCEMMKIGHTYHSIFSIYITDQFKFCVGTDLEKAKCAADFINRFIQNKGSATDIAPSSEPNGSPESDSNNAHSYLIRRNELPRNFYLEDNGDTSNGSITIKCDIHPRFFLIFGAAWVGFSLIWIAIVFLVSHMAPSDSRLAAGIATITQTPWICTSIVLSMSLLLITGIIFLCVGIKDVFYSTWFEVEKDQVSIIRGRQKNSGTRKVFPRDGSIRAEVYSNVKTNDMPYYSIRILTPQKIKFNIGTDLKRANQTADFINQLFSNKEIDIDP